MGALAILESKDILGAEDMRVLKDSKFKGFTDAEVNYAASVCRHLHLNPLVNQIHFVKRNTKAGAVISVQVGIDGLRLAAQRAGGYAGSDDGIFEFNDKKQIVKATVTVYKMVEGQRCPFTASADWDEYCPSAPLDAMWKKMPKTMLAKCAEAKALRKAFPAELSALQTDEEMAQADKAPSKAEMLNARVVNEAPTPEPEAPAEAEFTDVEFPSAPSVHGDYVCQVGKYKGQAVKDIPKEDVESYVRWARNQPTLNGKSLEFVEHSEKFLAGEMK